MSRMQSKMQGTAAAQKVSTGLTCRQSCLKRKRGPLSCRAAGSNGARQTTIHKLIEEHGNLIVPGIYDALSARICSQQGAKVAFLSGYAVRQCAHCGTHACTGTLERCWPSIAPVVRHLCPALHAVLRFSPAPQPIWPSPCL